jgi:ubiquinone/menaquinone biosynthesis C-methylase UbiE
LNLYHRWHCGSGRWRRRVEQTVLPWVLHGVDLGDTVLEIGSGPGVITDVLRREVSDLTCLEIDPRLASALRKRLEHTSVRVVEGDAAAMPFDDAEFAGVLSMTMLHHLPTGELQDALFSEAARVLRPGGVFAGMDSTPSLSWRLAHLMDTCTPVDPEFLETRLSTAGFGKIQIRVANDAFRFTAVAS